LKGGYLGQPPPGSSPELFAPNIVSTGMYERDVAITPDGKEIYYGLIWGELVTIMVTRLKEGRWTEPEIATFARDLEYGHFEPSITPDGKKLLFLCTRPPEGQEPKPGWGHQNIWAVNRQEDGSWSEPYDVGAPITTEANEFFPSVTQDGTLYFTRSTDREPALYRARWKGGEYGTPEKLPEPVNGKNKPYNAFIAPDESYLIACIANRSDSTTPGVANYYVFFRSGDDVWSDAIHMGDEINPPGFEAHSPYVSPDGKFFFFALSKKGNIDLISDDRMRISEIQKLYNSPQKGSADIYWVSAEIIERLRPR
jgi:Tol biopolymer transport system component